MHWFLDIDRGEVPLQAFDNKKASNTIRDSNTKWVEEDAND